MAGVTTFFSRKLIDGKHLSKFSKSVRLLLHDGKVASRSMSTDLDLSGIYPPIPTPFKANEDVDWHSLKSNLDKWSAVPFKGYVVQGSNGEYVSLSTEEKIDMVQFVAENVESNKTILVGSGCEGTKETIELTNEMAKKGAHAALVVTPAFFKNRMNSAAMINHYTQVADASSIPVILYNVPSNTGFEFPVDAIIKLSEHPNIIGFKDSGGNITNIGHIISETRERGFQVLAGGASFLMASMNLGAVGGICALANILGQECCDLATLCKEGRLDEARELQLKLIAPNQAVTRKYNVPALKYAMDLCGYYGGPSRSPLGPLNELEMKDVKNCFKEYC
eukprot:TCONS_00049812-protein